MARKRKRAAPRGPAKVSGALPAPKVSPARVRLPWYRRRVFQILLALGAVGLVSLGIWQFLAFRERSDQKERERRVVREFERAISLSEDTLDRVFKEMTSLPEQLKTGEIAAPEFTAKADKWLADLRDLDTELRQRTTPRRLQETRSLLVQGVLVFIDAAKTFELAAKTSDVTLRDSLIEQGRNLAIHAGSVYGSGLRALALERVRVGLATEEEAGFLLDQPPQLPPENAPSPEPSPAPGG